MAKFVRGHYRSTARRGVPGYWRHEPDPDPAYNEGCLDCVIGRAHTSASLSHREAMARDRRRNARAKRYGDYRSIERPSRFGSRLA